MAKAKTAPAYVPLSVRIEAGQKVALERAAKADGRTLSSLVQLIVREWLKAKK